MKSDFVVKFKLDKAFYLAIQTGLRLQNTLSLNLCNNKPIIIWSNQTEI